MTDDRDNDLEPRIDLRIEDHDQIANLEEIGGDLDETERDEEPEEEEQVP